MARALGSVIKTQRNISIIFPLGRELKIDGSKVKVLTNLSLQPSVQSHPTRKSRFVLMNTPSSGMRSLPGKMKKKKTQTLHSH